VDLIGITRALTPEQVETAYRRGVFPMGDPDFGVITWHRPSRRALIPLESFHVSGSLARTMRRVGYTVTVDKDFDAVMRGCADRPSTWITSEIRAAYGELHRRGKAHSLEIWLDDFLAGGIYGVHLGGAFFAESKFHRVRDMSKVALACLVERLRRQDFLMLEVQYLTPHLAQFGAVEVSARDYQRRLNRALAVERGFL